jgi:DNA-binding MarR family transcriptional regulator
VSDDIRQPAVGLDDVVHQRVRLGVLVMLGEMSECAFSTLRDELHVTDGNLNRHVQVLVDAGLVAVRKGYEANRPRTWLKLTREGRKALRTELKALEDIVTRLRQIPPDDLPSPAPPRHRRPRPRT